jgi:hypothetical protein
VEAYFSELGDLIQEELEKGQDSRCIAVGEIGLGMSIHSPFPAERYRLNALGQTTTDSPIPPSQRKQPISLVSYP